MEKKLFRNLHDRKIAGVASGVADYLKIEVNIVRLLFILSSFFLGGVGLITYIVLWILSPVKNDPSAKFKKFDEFFNQNKKPFEAPNAFGEQNNPINSKWNTENFDWKKKDNKKITTFIGIFLLVIGTFFLLHQLELIPNFITFGKLWPLFLIFWGIILIVNATKTNEFEAFKKEQEKQTEPIITTPPTEGVDTETNQTENI